MLATGLFFDKLEALGMDAKYVFELGNSEDNFFGRATHQQYVLQNGWLCARLRVGSGSTSLHHVNIFSTLKRFALLLRFETGPGITSEC